MKAKYLCTSFILCLIIFFSQQSLLTASSDKKAISFKFYNIGADDTIAATAEKLAANGFDCGSAKSPFLGIQTAQEVMKGRKYKEKIHELITIDENLKEFGKGLDYEEMPIDVLVCAPPKDNPFKFSAFFFSGFEKKILAIDIEIEKFNTVKDKLASKYGSCILEGYCESENSILILTKKKGWQLHVYFSENIRPHYEKIKKLKNLKDKKLKEQINEAF